MDNIETKGMLVRNMDDRLFVAGNPFHEALKAGSKVFGAILDDKIKSRRSSSKPITTFRPSTSATRLKAKKPAVTFTTKSTNFSPRFFTRPYEDDASSGFDTHSRQSYQAIFATQEKPEK